MASEAELDVFPTGDQEVQLDVHPIGYLVVVLIPAGSSKILFIEIDHEIFSSFH